MLGRMAPTPRIPPELLRELGGYGPALLAGSTDPWEATPELQWPQSLAVWDKIRRSDSQCGSTAKAVKLPAQRTGWRIPSTPDVPERIRAFVEAELGLVTDARGRRRRRRSGVSWDEFLRHALLHLDFGHMPFEQVYEIGPGETPELAGRQVAHLRKLAPRLPRSLSGIDINPDGGLRGIRQWVDRGQGRLEEVSIGVDRLVMFTNEREGGDWAGRSIYRSAYKHWLLKDTMLRLSVSAADRQSMGIPVGTVGEGGDVRKMEKLVSALRSGDDAGAAIEAGQSLTLLGITGQVFDMLPWVKYHDEAAGRSTLTMFLNLGHDSGARSLGDTFVDFFLMAEGALIAYIEEVVTEHVIRDLVVLNFGEDAPYPQLVADELTAESVPTAASLTALVEAGLIVVDEPLRADVRRRYNLPAELPVPEGEPAAPLDPNAPPPAPGAPTGTGVGAPAAIGTPVKEITPGQAAGAPLRTGPNSRPAAGRPPNTVAASDGPVDLDGRIRLEEAIAEAQAVLALTG